MNNTELTGPNRLTVLAIDVQKRTVTLINKNATFAWEMQFSGLSWLSRKRYGNDKQTLENLDRVLFLCHPLFSEEEENSNRRNTAT